MYIEVSETSHMTTSASTKKDLFSKFEASAKIQFKKLFN